MAKLAITYTDTKLIKEFEEIDVGALFRTNGRAGLYMKITQLQAHYPNAVELSHGSVHLFAINEQVTITTKATLHVEF